MLAERLALSGVTDPPPAWGELRQDPGFAEDLASLEPVHCAVLAEVVERDYRDIDREDLALVLDALVAGVVNIDDGLMFASAVERVVWACVIADAEDVPSVPGAAFATKLTDVVAEYLAEPAAFEDDGERSLRCYFAVGAACDLVCAGQAREFGLFGVFERASQAMPAVLAGAIARAAGRVGDLVDDPIVESTLTRCLAHAVAGSDAALELGHLELRRAFSGAPEQIGPALDTALSYYRDAATDEQRPDARAHAAAVEVLLAFVAGTAADAIAEQLVVLHRAVADLASGVETGDTPSRGLSSTAAWLRMSGRLRDAAHRDPDDDALQPEQALVPLLDLYADSRVRVVGDEHLDLAVAIRPAVSSRLAARTTRPVLEALARRLPDGTAAQKAAQELAELEVGEGLGKAHTVPVPARLAGVLGVAEIATSDPEASAQRLHTLDLSLGEAERPQTMVRLVEESVWDTLGQEPLFVADVAEAVVAVTSAVVRYVAQRTNNPRPFMRADAAENEHVIEQDLADDFQEWLAGHLDFGSPSIEAQRVAAGRVDVTVGFSALSVVIELKKEESDISPEGLASHYAEQTVSYQATNYPFGIALVLDRTPGIAATPHLSDLIWAAAADIGGRNRWIVWAVLPGRLVTPSEHSRTR